MARWDAEQLANARTIIAVGAEMGMSRRDITVALMTAMQESSLRNLSGGDRDSAGLFQQRPSQGWGSYQQVTNPLYSARKFFTTLRGVKGRAAMSLSGAAQAVQRSAFPSAYAKWESDALRLLGQSGMRSSLPFPVSKPFSGLDMDGSLAGTQATAEQTPGTASVSEDKVSPAAPGSGASIEDVSAPAQPAEVDTGAIKELMAAEFPAVGAHVGGIRGKLIAGAKQSLGTPYVWGGKAPGGFDCSGLIYYWYNRLGVRVPRVSQDQVLIGRQTDDLGQLAPGDFVGFGNDAHHIAIYLGGDRILEAPHSGAVVRIRKLRPGEDFFGVKLNLPGGSGEDFAMTSGAKRAAAAADSFASGIQAPDLTDEDIEKLAQGAGAATAAGPITNFPGLVSDVEGI